MFTETLAQTFTFTRSVNAPSALVYRAFTNATALREWYADNAQVDARVEGALFLSWHIGYYVVGNFTALKPDEHVAFSWHGRGEPYATHVDVHLDKSGEGTQVTIRHSGIGEGEGWAQIAQQFRGEWESALENLQSVLETGLDLRLMRRPMLGIYPSLLDAATAERLSIPVKQGLLLDGVLDGLGAQAAGLQIHDVIVKVDGHSVTDWPSLQMVITPHKAGDVIAVEFYRGSQKQTVQMKLSGRPAPDVPATVEGLVERLTATQRTLDSELDSLLADVTETEAAYNPAPNEWNIKEVVAHLIWTERFNQMWIWGNIGGDDSIPWPDNNRAQLEPLLAVYPTMAELVAELKRAEAGTIAAVAHLPAAFMSRKSSYLRLAQAVTSSAEHSRQHFAQIKAAAQQAK
ncbi:MAG: SRPBCC domain-containing protein [Anaerolineae bacterium]|nr:SRPBCC domain-containing protein [Anaerolineae bacterium]